MVPAVKGVGGYKAAFLLADRKAGKALASLCGRAKRLGAEAEKR